MAKLNIIGQIMGTSGYSSHTSQLAAALSKDHDVRLSVGLPQGWERLVNDQQLEQIRKEDSQDRINIIIDLPYTWIYHADKKINIGFLIFEGDKIPKSWIKYLMDERIKQIWCPSSHVQQAVVNTLQSRENYLMTTEEQKGIFDKIKIVPHGVDLNLFKPENKPEKFTFICNKGFRNLYDRGGIQYAVKAFCSEFKLGEAKLLVKLNPAYATNSQALQYMIQQLNLGDTIKDVQFSMEQVPMEMMGKIYNSGHVFLSPTGAEAFNLPCAESLACGLAVITSNFGGQIDYVDSSCGILIGGELREVKNEIFYEGVRWLRPDMNELRKAMRYAYEHPKEMEEKGKKGIEKMKEWTWENSAKLATKFLEELK